MDAVRTVRSRTGAVLPVLGQGTWLMGERAVRRADEVRALRLGLDLGLTLIDTAEMYGEGGAEEVVGEAIAGRRDEVFLVSKVYPHNASRRGAVEAAERSLRRLATDRIDLYLLHWSGSHPIADTLAAFEELRSAGKVLHFGVSNLDLDEMEESEACPGGGDVAANQILYNLGRRGPERDLMPWCRERDVVVMAYAPLEQGQLRVTRALRDVAARHDATPEQVALAWTLREPGVVTVVKAGDETHLRADAAVLDLALTAADVADLDAAYPRPDHDVPLECL